MKANNETASHKESKRQEAAPQQTPLQSTGEIRQEEIQRRAYEIYIERGGTHGQDLDDWIQAERELQAKHRST